MKKTIIKKKLEHKIQDMYNLNKLSVLILDQKTLSTIFDKCLPEAGGSEFQVHYRSLTFECTKESNNGIIYFTIPTVFYNMPQEVTSVSIDYHTDEIFEHGEMVKPLSTAMAQTPEIASIMDILEGTFDNVELTEIADNSFHRHPSNSTFSSIDYDTDPENPGVIFRKGTCKNLLQTDSVMYMNGSKASLVVTESRIATVDKHADGTVKAQYVEIPTKMYIKKERHTAIMDMFGREPEVKIEQMNSALLKDDYQELNLMVENIFNSLPEPMLDFIEPTYIKEKPRTYSYGHYRKDNKKDTKSVKTNRKYDQDEIALATMYGYDLLMAQSDVEEWEEYREFYIHGEDYGY